MEMPSATDAVERIATPKENEFAKMKEYLEGAGFRLINVCGPGEQVCFRPPRPSRFEHCLIPVSVGEDGEPTLYGVFARGPDDRCYDREDSLPARRDSFGYTVITTCFSEDLPRMIQGLEKLAQEKLGMINGHGGKYAFQIAVLPFDKPERDGAIEPYSYKISGRLVASSPIQALTPQSSTLPIQSQAPRVSGHVRRRMFDLIGHLVSPRKPERSQTIEA